MTVEEGHVINIDGGTGGSGSGDAAGGGGKYKASSNDRIDSGKVNELKIKTK